MQAPVKGQEMEVADLDEAQSKKVFRARKTMKISDRQQLESIHNSHSSSALSSSTGATSSSTPPPAVVNGKDPEEEQTAGESHTDTNPKETRPTPPASRTPSPLTLSLSLSPSPPSQSPQLPSGSNACLSPAHSPKSAGNESDREEGDGEGEKERPSVAEGVKTADEKMEGGEVKEKEDSAGPQVEDKEDENPKPDGDVSSPLDSPHDPTISPASPMALETKDEESKTETGKRTESEEAVAMDTDPAPMEIEALEDKSIPATDMVSSSSPSPSPSHAPESDLEVKEGFLVLSEEDENQGEKDEEKEKQEVKEIESGEEMDVDMKKDEEKEHVSDTAPPSPTSSPATPPTGDPEADTGHSTLSGKKRTLCADLEVDRENKGEEVVREGKRQKVEGEELEAQLELKIRADTSSRHKLEKVVQQLVEEQLRVLQLSVFDRSLQELRERVEKIDCATKHQQTLNSLQAKIARLAKKFGAANQTKENIRKPLEGTLLTPTMTTPTSTASTTSTFRSVRTTMDSKQSNQSPATRSLSSTVRALWKNDDEDANNSSSPDTEADTDEEWCHFELRTDPAQDQLHEGADQETLPGSPRPRSTPARRPRKRSGSTSWKTEKAADVAPPAMRFHPAREPGVQLRPAEAHTPLDLFKLFFSTDAVKTLCRNTNEHAARAIARGSKYKWADIGMEEFYKYIGLIFYMALLKLNDIRDYWRQSNIFSVAFPATIMTRDRYRAICWNVHMSNVDEAQENDRKRGTPEHDKLFRVRPLMDTIQHACKAFYHPRRNLSVDERMVATRANTGMTQYMKEKPIKWGFKLFVLCDSSNGYTVDFAVYTGKSSFQTGQGLSYNTVMSLVKRAFLGSGYHVYMDNFYTSPKLFRDLYRQNFGACGTYRDNRKEYPQPACNALTKSSGRGALRWIRDGPLVFVKWMDAREVSVCSTIHAAFTGDTIERKVKEDGVWISKNIPCPSPIIQYNAHMGGVDLSDQLIQYYTAQHKTMRWYRKLFFHFLDIAATNAYILHKELSSLGQQEAMTHKAFMEELSAQLCGVSQKAPDVKRRESYDHVPVRTGTQILGARMAASVGRKTCKLCRMNIGKKQNTPWKCKECDVPLCLQPDRNCFEKWHMQL
ncbi:activating transcription factor 7-interacting protein 1 isoform X1 [Anguilla rostrata]|uniref:activating transcription factor 7-interacting protein 1 isoform X1 n=2 Tax=Anguilla rostrata TaxID=7938 RepID=UPI0030D4C6EE